MTKIVLNDGEISIKMNIEGLLIDQEKTVLKEVFQAFYFAKTGESLIPPIAEAALVTELETDVDLAEMQEEIQEEIQEEEQTEIVDTPLAGASPYSVFKELEEKLQYIPDSSYRKLGTNHYTYQCYGVCKCQSKVKKYVERHFKYMVCPNCGYRMPIRLATDTFPHVDIHGNVFIAGYMRQAEEPPRYMIETAMLKSTENDKPNRLKVK